MIEAHSLTKRYGDKTVIDSLSFQVEPGVVTGFLGPNGAGKSTTMRMIVGLDRPTSGTVTVGGRPYVSSPAPLHEVGILLDARAAHPGRTARNHLRVIAASNGIPTRRVDHVIGMTGLDAVASKRVGTFSLGMGQRLGIAAALLGDPRVVILDEPVNGLDPEGVQWVRRLTRSLADEGRTVLLSSHLMEEMAKTADRIIVLGRGRLVADASVTEILEQAGGGAIRIRSSELDRLSALLAGEGVVVSRVADEVAEVRNATVHRIAELAARERIVLYEITEIQASLEAAFFALTHDDVEYRTSNHGETAR